MTQNRRPRDSEGPVVAGAGGSDSDPPAPSKIINVGPAPSEQPHHKPTSERRIEANRRNAQRSTGPLTDEGKKTSSRNAEKHGGLSTMIEPIKSGWFAEDRAAFYTEMDRLVASLAPEGAVEEALAHRIAGVLIKLGRIDRWVVAVIEGEDDSGQWRLGGVLSMEQVASKILSGPMNLEYKYHQRAVRDLVTLLTELRNLQAFRSTS